MTSQQGKHHSYLPYPELMPPARSHRYLPLDLPVSLRRKMTCALWTQAFSQPLCGYRYVGGVHAAQAHQCKLRSGFSSSSP